MEVGEVKISNKEVREGVSEKVCEGAKSAEGAFPAEGALRAKARGRTLSSMSEKHQGGQCGWGRGEGRVEETKPSRYRGHKSLRPASTLANTSE